MSGIGALGLEPRDAPPPPDGLPKHLRDVDHALRDTEDLLDVMRCELNRFRLAVEDIAVDEAAGVVNLKKTVARLRKFSTEFAMEQEGMSGHVKTARKRIRQRARRLAKLRAPSAVVIPLHPPARE